MKCTAPRQAFPNSRWALTRVLCALPLFLLVVSASACHRRQVRVPSPPQPSAPAASSPSTPEQPPEAAPAQPAPTQPAPTQPAPAQPAPAQPAPAQPSPSSTPSPVPRRPRPPAGTPAPQPSQGPANPAPPAAPAPRLGQVLTPEQQKEYNGAIDQSLERAQGSLRAIGNRQLSAEQRASLEEIQNFIRQAQATRASDLPGARRLAERAEVLARNLERSVH
ncbi:MAG TPA: hypothetical protein VEV17_02010 [Bryobacteraceae bacterium]|nr:hypothetical protein [Bryobacteraceae bacterium]